MLPLCRLAVLAAWVGVPSRPHCQRHRPPKLNWLDDYKAEASSGGGPGFTNQVMDSDAAEFMVEVNFAHMEELRQVARVKGLEDGVDWTREYLSSVQVTSVDNRGMLLQEVICSASDQRCIAVDVVIPWPSNAPARRLPEMLSAFVELSRCAYARPALDEFATPPEYQAQQKELDELMSLMNGQFGKLLRFYALKHSRLEPSRWLSPTETVEQCRLTQLTYEGLSLELKTLDLGAYSLEFGEARVTRQKWSTSILFANRCQSAEEVEMTLLRMFDNTAAAVEEGRINVEGVAPEPEAEAMANAQNENEYAQADARLDLFCERDRRLRWAVRARRIANSNRATARYMAASREWQWNHESGDY